MPHLPTYHLSEPASVNVQGALAPHVSAAFFDIV